MEIFSERNFDKTKNLQYYSGTNRKVRIDYERATEPKKARSEPGA